MLAGRTAITFRQYLCRRGYNYLTTGEVMSGIKERVETGKGK
jgi:hypothetical protein